MIVGSVTAFREPVIRLAIHGPSGPAHEIEAVIDTGFNGALSLPPALIAALDLRWRTRARAVLADGSPRLFDIHEATIEWDGAPRRTLVHAADSQPLVGMTLLDGYELTIQGVPGGAVTITALA